MRLFCLGLFFCSLWFGVRAFPQTPTNQYEVIHLGDSGPGSLREGVQTIQSLGGGMISLVKLRGSLTLDQCLPEIVTRVKIVGPGNHLLRITGFNSTNGALRIGGTGCCWIENVDFEAFGSLTHRGPAVIHNRGELRLAGCVFSHNAALDSAAALTSDGLLELAGCAFLSNTQMMVISTGLGGGAVQITGGMVAIEQTRFERNECIGTSEGRFNFGLEGQSAFYPASRARGGALSMNATNASCRSCLFVSNACTGGSPGGSAEGGAIYSQNSSLSALSCGFVSNFVSAGEGRATPRGNLSGGNAAGGAIHLESGRLTLLSSGLAGNRAHALSYNGIAKGGGLSHYSGEAFFQNVTVSENQAHSGFATGQNDPFGCFFQAGMDAFGGGIYLGDVKASLVHCTIARNGSKAGRSDNECPQFPIRVGMGWGGGIYSERKNLRLPSGDWPEEPTLRGCIVASNITEPIINLSADVGGLFRSRGHNLFSVITNSVFIDDTDYWNVSAQLGGLQNNPQGLPVITPLPSSLAIDHGGTSPPINVDQNGSPRPRGGGVDIGSIEVDANPRTLPPAVWRQPSDHDGLVGQRVRIGAVVSGSEPIHYQWFHEGVPLQGETNSHLIMASATVHQNGMFFLVASNAYGIVKSDPARVKLRTPEPGELWNIVPGAPTPAFVTTVQGRGPFVAIGSRTLPSGFTLESVYASEDGLEWVRRHELDPKWSGKNASLAYSRGVFLVLAGEGALRPAHCDCQRALMSTNSLDWFEFTIPFAERLEMPFGIPDGFMALHRASASSMNPVKLDFAGNVQVLPSSLQGTLLGGIYREPYFVWASDNSTYYSTNGVHWIQSFLPFTSGGSFGEKAALWNDGERLFLKSTRSNPAPLYSSTNGLDWIIWGYLSNRASQIVSSGGGWIAYSPSRFQTASSDVLEYSIDGRVWREVVQGLAQLPYEETGFSFSGLRIQPEGWKFAWVTPDSTSPSLEISVGGLGKVSVSGNGPPWTRGETVLLHAHPGSGYRFLQWSDWVRDNPRSVSVDLVNRYKAVFVPLTPLETLEVGGVSRLGMPGEPVFIAAGTLVTNDTVLLREPGQVRLYSSNPDVKFAWTLDGTSPKWLGVAQDPEVNVTRSGTLRAAAFLDGTRVFESSFGILKIALASEPLLSLQTRGGGRVQSIPSQGPFSRGTKVRLEAIADTGWTFLGWVGHTTNGDGSVYVIMDGDQQVEGVFGAGPPVFSAPSEVGATHILTSPALGAIPYGTKVRFTALATSQLVFDYWRYGDEIRRENPLELVLTNASVLGSAVYRSKDPLRATLTLRVKGPGQVIRFPSPESAGYRLGSEVRLIARPDFDQSFLGWSGDLSSGEIMTTLVMDRDREVTAEFSSPSALHICFPSLSRSVVSLELLGLSDEAQTVEKNRDGQWIPFLTLTNTLGRSIWNDPIDFRASRVLYRLKGSP